jgi:hypothetical protein
MGKPLINERETSAKPFSAIVSRAQLIFCARKSFCFSIKTFIDPHFEQRFYSLSAHKRRCCCDLRSDKMESSAAAGWKSPAAKALANILIVRSARLRLVGQTHQSRLLSRSCDVIYAKTDFFSLS